MTAKPIDPQDATASFESNRRFLRGLAYRMLGSVAEAEDIVQNCWLRWRDVDHADIAEPRAFLARAATRLCLDRLKSAQKQREQYVGVWLPEPWLDDPLSAEPGADDIVSTAQQLEVAFMLVLHKLTPAERAVFLLSEVFDWDFDAIAHMLDRTPAACRQLAHRARRVLTTGAQPDHATAAPISPDAGRASAHRGPGHRHNSPRDPRREMLVAMAFARALQQGDVQALADTLAEDVVFMSDGGGKANAVPLPLHGAAKVAQVLAGFAKLWAREPAAQVRPALINTLPGAIFESANGQVIQTMALEIGSESRIQGVYVVRNPDKLRHVPSQPDHSDEAAMIRSQRCPR